MTTSKERQQYWDRKTPNWIRHDEFAGEKYGLIHFVREGLENLRPHLPTRLTMLNIGSGANNNDYVNGIISADQILATDISRAMLHENTARHKILADAEAPLPLRSNSIDLITSFYLMRYLTQKNQGRLIHEIRRVLRPGGWMVLIDLPRNNYGYQEAEFLPHQLVKEVGHLWFNQLTPVFHDQGSYWIGALYGQKRLNPIDRRRNIVLWPRDSVYKEKDQLAYERSRDLQEGAHGF